MMLATVVQEDFRVPDAILAFNSLADSADLLAYNYFNAETLPAILPPGEAPTEPRNGESPDTPISPGENTTDEHYQGIARSFGTGTAYLYVSGSGSLLDDEDDFPDSDKSPEPRANLLVGKIASAQADGERLGPNRFTERVDEALQAPFGNPPPEDRIVNNIFFNDYGHIGGMDTAGQILAISLERPLDTNFQPTDDGTVPHGAVRFLDISDPGNPSLIPGVEVIPSYFSNIYDGANGEVGVVALTRLNDGTFFLALSAKNGVDVLFYRSNGTNFFEPGFNFGPLSDEVTTLSGPVIVPAPYQTTRPFDVLSAQNIEDGDVRVGTIGPLSTPWPVNYITSGNSVPSSHQNFNFITEADGDLYLIGSRNDCGGNSFICPFGDDADDWIDLYSVTFQEDGADPQLGAVALNLLRSREVEIKEGHLAHVGGSYVTPTGELLYYSGDGYNYEGGEANRIKIGELRSTTMSTGTSPIRGIVATTDDGVFTKTSRTGIGQFLEAGDTTRISAGGVGLGQ